ncbi:DUF4004 family protein [Peribacillus sp. SCS-37]|uniref:DUF4004 family protein n=1 Tax=Paraperibacillus esterisolvens TaxID=3115296 RepID=UPI003905D67F
MEDQLISKKDLLELAGISYGQLYRWKRKNLIPDDWFIRKSTFTGQETFFPRTRMMDRIAKIQNMKEGEMSLDDIAAFLAPGESGVSVSRGELLENGIISSAALEIAKAVITEEHLNFFEALYLKILDVILHSGEANKEEGRMVLEFLSAHDSIVKEGRAVLYIFRKMGVTFVILGRQGEQLFPDNQTKTVLRLEIDPIGEEMKEVFNGGIK